MKFFLKYFLYKTLLFLHLGGDRSGVVTKLNRSRAKIMYLKDPDYRLIARSRLFDEKWYLERHPELKIGNVDAIAHYLASGWKDSDPSEKFSSLGYLEANEDVKNAGINPLLHYLRDGKKEGRRWVAFSVCGKVAPVPAIDIPNGEILFCKNRLSTTSYEEIKCIDVLIPVYNGLTHLKNLLPGLFANTNIPHRFIFIDDCSSELEVLAWLREQIRGRTDCLLLVNEENLGFPATVNRAAAIADSEIFVILNTDTRVPEGWLQRLCSPLLEDLSVASATPFSNAATIFSFPLQCDDVRNRRFLDAVGLEKIDSALRESAFPVDVKELEAPTGVGFCMAIRKSAWEACDGFDADTFEKGYGEEVDWCQKMRSCGLRHVLVPNLFVAHVHGGSFASDVKEQALKRAGEIICSRYPNYDREVAEHISRDPFALIRAVALLRLAETVFSDGELFLAHALGGGAHKYLKRRIEKNLESSVFGGATLTWRNKTNTLELELCFRDFRVALRGLDFSTLFADRFPRFKNIVVNELVTWPESVEKESLLKFVSRLKSHWGATLTFLFHDFYAICPKITCCDKTWNFCRLPRDMNICSACASDGKAVRIDMNIRRQDWGEFLSVCDRLVFFSENTYKIAESVFHFDALKCKVVPHLPLHLFPGNYKIPGGGLRRIGVVGGINQEKGSLVVGSLSRFLKRRKLNVEILVFGEIFGAEILSNVKVLGRYNGSELQNILQKSEVQVVLFPSVCPETFSYVIQELMQIEVPVACFDVGAPADRIREYGRGAIIHENTPECVFDVLNKLHDKCKQR